MSLNNNISDTTTNVKKLLSMEKDLKNLKEEAKEYSETSLLTNDYIYINDFENIKNDLKLVFGYKEPDITYKSWIKDLRLLDITFKEGERFKYTAGKINQAVTTIDNILDLYKTYIEGIEDIYNFTKDIKYKYVSLYFERELKSNIEKEVSNLYYKLIEPMKSFYVPFISDNIEFINKKEFPPFIQSFDFYFHNKNSKNKRNNIDNLKDIFKRLSKLNKYIKTIYNKYCKDKYFNQDFEINNKIMQYEEDIKSLSNDILFYRNIRRDIINGGGI